MHCVKSVQIRSFFWPEFSNIQSEYGKIWNWKNSVLGYFSHRVACVSTCVSKFLFGLVLPEYCGGLPLNRCLSFQKTVYHFSIDYCVFSCLLFSWLLAVAHALFFSVLFLPSKIQTCKYYWGEGNQRYSLESNIG